MISFRPVVEEGVACRRESEEVCFPKAQSP
jgi:hypothetical protein